MKKAIITISILLGFCLSTFADGGIFQRGYNASKGKSGYAYFNTNGISYHREDDPFNTPMLPAHGEDTNQPAPVGSGITVLMGLGITYWMAGKRKKE